jgi:nitroreductase
MGESPVLVIGCTTTRRLEGVPAAQAASALGNILPAMWSFMLAARARGLGTAWTTIHLAMEQAVADIVDIPFDTMQQVCLTPLAFTKGTDFKPALRPDPDTVIDWR